MQVALTFTGRSLEPYQEQDLETLKDGFAVGELVSVDVKKARNLAHHRKFFALLRQAIDNSERWSNEQDCLTELKVRVGHYMEHITADGQVVYMPKSINFNAMDQILFDGFYGDALIELDKLIPGIPDIESEASQIIAWRKSQQRRTA